MGEQALPAGTKTQCASTAGRISREGKDETRHIPRVSLMCDMLHIQNMGLPIGLRNRACVQGLEFCGQGEGRGLEKLRPETQLRGMPN
jgi:hypothetical protein